MAPPVEASVAPACPAEVGRASLPPGIAAAQLSATYWADRLPPGEADRVVLNAVQIGALNARNEASTEGFKEILSPALGGVEVVAQDLAERVAWVGERFGSGKYLETAPGAFAEAVATLERALPEAELRLVTAEADLRCLPTAHGFYAPPVDAAFDRNRCSGLHPGELVRVLRATPDGAWRYVHSGHSSGWLHQAPLGPPISTEEARAFQSPGRRLVVTGDHVPSFLGSGGPGPTLRMGTSFPIVTGTPDGRFEIRVPTARGLETASVGEAGVHEGWLPMTRRAVLGLAFSQLDARYGWGDRQGHRDCSRYLLDLFAVFGIRLPRHSAAQVQVAVERVSLAGLGEPERVARLSEAGRQGIVLIYFPGHIMLYLGEDGGKPFAISALAEYLEPCPGGGHTVVKLDRVVVTDLELGRRTERTAYLERVTDLGVFR
jgi:hypothetical protein